jgi:HNH endonuclease/NUMOD4 motif
MRVYRCRPIPSYEELYSITADGKVFSYGRFEEFYQNGIKRYRNYKSRWLLPHTTPKGYLQVDLFKNKKPRRFYIHVLVLTIFGPLKPSLKHQVNHKDLNKSNNKIWNLEWKTPKENTHHALANGHVPTNLSHPGSINPNSKCTEADIIEIRRRADKGENLKALAKEFNISYCNLHKIARRKLWTHI